jgi:exonuclease III
MLLNSPHTNGVEPSLGNLSEPQTRGPGTSHVQSQMQNTNASDNSLRHSPPRHPDTNMTISVITPQQSQRKTGLQKRANIKIATLNMNGAHTNGEACMRFEKWAEINATMKRENIAILALQETHLDDHLLSDVNKLFGKRLIIHNSPSEVNPRSSVGVVFVLNKDLIETHNMELKELVKGRALALKTTWNNQEEIALINVYAPNRRMDHKPFWEAVETARRSLHLRKPDFVLGDFNVTEDAIDRSPLKRDSERASDALRDFCLALNIQDQWRHTFPKTKEFTYRATINGKQVKSRLDRIYVSTNKTRFTYEWVIGPSSVPTDHWLASVRYSPKGAPHIGKGRWTWPLKQVKNAKLMERIESKGIALQQDIRDGSQNVQSLWKTFKSEISEMAKKEAKKSHYRRLTTLRNLQKDRKTLLDNPTFETDEQLKWQEALIANRIEHLERVNSHNNRARLKAKIALHSEKLGGVWSDLNKVKKLRDTILRLAEPNTTPPHFVTRSDKMASLAKTYHHTLQEQDLPVYDESDERETDRVTDKITEVLDAIPEHQKFNPTRYPKLSRVMTSEYVAKALKLAKNNSATGLDGCPYELWKTLNKMYTEAQKANRTGFDVIGTLTSVFQDIQYHGVKPDSDFTEGWMCPIFKKKDRTRIENYRPITLLNSDYKILTKALSLQLLDPIDRMIHRDQAGFIPGRSIFDHIHLTRVMITYAEAMEINGAIIALDQEKAYNRIAHEYLWKTLEAFNLLQCFISTVKALYHDAKTSVAVNGVLSEPFPVKRGVRQGDPLSCFLFNIGIEPLACMIRNSERVRSFVIPGSDDRLVVNLFADDTVVYVNANNKFDNLQRILDKWCRASGAKFNKEKTEIIPIGTEAHRGRIIRTRKIHPADAPLNYDVHIANDSEAIRSLGSWVGNNTKDEAPWEPIIDKVNKELNRTNLSHPSLKGKRLLSQIIVSGRTQFLAKAQGMPDRVRDVLTKLIKSFIWGDNVSPRLALDWLHKKRGEGGIELLNL